MEEIVFFIKIYSLLFDLNSVVFKLAIIASKLKCLGYILDIYVNLSSNTNSFF